MMVPMIGREIAAIRPPTVPNNAIMDEG